jgi:hypothetical protein
MMLLKSKNKAVNATYVDGQKRHRWKFWNKTSDLAEASDILMSRRRDVAPPWPKSMPMALQQIAYDEIKAFYDCRSMTIVRDAHVPVCTSSSYEEESGNEQARETEEFRNFLADFDQDTLAFLAITDDKIAAYLKDSKGLQGIQVYEGSLSKLSVVSDLTDSSSDRP